MFKKSVSMALVIIMVISILTGCGVNELGYLNLSKEIGNVTQFSFNNSTQIEISKEAAGDDYNVDLNLKGVVNIEDLQSMYMSFDLIFKVNELGIEEPINFKIADNKLYVSKNSILEIVAYENLLNGASESEKIIEEMYNSELKEIEYILLTDLDETQGMHYEVSYTDLYDDAMEYLTTAFKGFDSKLITKVTNGYSLELTPESTVEFIERLITYISENKELVFDETVKYVEKIYNSTEFEDVTAEEKEELIAELKASRQDFYDFIDEAVLILETDELKLYEEMFQGSRIKEKIYKEGNSYRQICQAEIVYENSLMGKLSSNTVITPQVVEKIDVTEGIIAIDELEDLYNKTENKINPVKKIQLQWYADDLCVQVDISRLDGKADWDSQPYSLIEDRVYLPLRYIGEQFGEEVQWDNEYKKAYVVRNNEKIDMTGLLIDSKTMVKVRDFEKLGYKINYNQVEGLSTATIEK
ncbi:MAG: stalk domain-containing protein [Sedimentibacter sp.]|uniref:stalk domain-containing protein n=1 Tax=Sedimentibacter sp. TaxID=1960295 RepID=UPI002982A8BC|nr:stalk domain-containing protein [Sedimentibacter sp.]MDW5299605.1 stalk domain-containing protein [Sedimentibacter sp.]